MLNEIFGDCPQIKVVDYLLMNPFAELSKLQIAVGAGISRITLNKFIDDLTKYEREKLDLDKSHVNDAFIISHNPDAERLDVEYLYRKVRRHNRSIHKNKPSKGGLRKRNQSSYIVNGYRRFDKVKYKNIVCFITGKRSSGYFQLKTFDGTLISQGVSSKKLKLLEPIKGWLIDWRAAIPPQPKEVEVFLP